jgi:hypothetical protein
VSKPVDSIGPQAEGECQTSDQGWESSAVKPFQLLPESFSPD